MNEVAAHDVATLLDDVRRGRVRVKDRTQAIALVLHGGRAEERQPSRWRDISYLRMLPFAASIARASKGRVAPVLVHNTHGGWIAKGGSGVVQAREVIRELVEKHGLPVIVLGHSSGGWVALRVAADPGVAGVVALAPWVGERERTMHLRSPEVRVRVIHGDADDVCDPERARELVQKIDAAGADATFELVEGGNHALLDAPRQWHGRAARAVLDLVPGPATAG